ncbi:hypothetical protein FQK02_22780 [Xanthomonas vasicola]|nr:hypothetical protein FQK02_22780 [Xanthomonas vasicola]
MAVLAALLGSTTEPVLTVTRAQRCTKRSRVSADACVSGDCPGCDHAVEQMTRLATLPSSSTRTWRSGELLCALTKRHPTGWAGRAHRISEQAMQRHRATFRSDWIACSNCLVGNMCCKPSGSCRQPLDPRRQIAQRAMRLFQFVVGLQAQPEALSRS